MAEEYDFSRHAPCTEDEWQTLVAERDALRVSVAELEAWLDGSCNAEELRQTRVERDRLQTRVAELEHDLSTARQHVLILLNRIKP